MNRKYSNETRAQAVAAIRDTGLPMRDIAECFEVSTTTVWNWMIASGHTPRSQVKATCHTDRPMYAKGTCKACYQRAWKAR